MVTINNVKGTKGNILYAVIILDDDSYSDSFVEHWRGESYDDVADQLKWEGRDENYFIINEVGTYEV
jgi:hypothetical protein